MEHRALRIALVAPLLESVPPRLYGGTERVVSYLADELVRQGYDVTLFASGDSRTDARLVPATPVGLRLRSDCVDPISHHVLLLDQVVQAADEFDVIHFHIDYLHFPLSRHLHLPAVTTVHGRLDIPDLVPLYRQFRDAPLVSISNAQRAPLAWANWQATVYHGLPADLYRFHAGPGEYLAFLGRISPEKRPDRAIDIARRAGLPLKIAAKVDPLDGTYYEEHIRPLIVAGGAEYVGEISEHEKDEFLGNALALLFPIDWPEPFGLAMIEALACGTPVIAYRCGSVPEVLTHGVTGFVVDSDDAAVAAVAKVPALDRAACRQRFEKYFSVGRMARDYLSIYRRICEAVRPPLRMT